MKPTKERRAQPRAKGTPRFTVDLKPHGPAVQVRDISLSGISFRLSDPIEFMTRLIMTLEFPVETASKESTAPDSIQCEGAVVRCDPVDDGKKDAFEVAVFFTQLGEQAKKVIREYVHTHR
jgi:hypothetical protein